MHTPSSTTCGLTLTLATEKFNGNTRVSLLGALKKNSVYGLLINANWPIAFTIVYHVVMTRTGNAVLYITLGRLTASPIFVALFCLAINDPRNVTSNLDVLLLSLALLVFILQEVADVVAGLIAKGRLGDSELRPILDPLADSLTHLGAFMCLLWVGLVPVWLPVAMVYRDGIVSVLRVVAARRGAFIGARFTTSLKAACHGLAAVVLVLVLMVASAGHQVPVKGISEVVAWLLILVNVASLADYYFAFRRISSR